MGTSSHTVTIPSATRHLATVRRFIGEQAEAAGLPDRAVDAVRLAVDEACANAIEHAYRGREDGEVEVVTEQSPGRFTVIIRHRGIPFDPSSDHPADLHKAVAERRSGGFGVRLMHRLVDHVEYRLG
ncbi:MAG: ATP-binding protein, partial [Rhodothermales bacterium]|nr:ATP-binding protein [Rhodothermales bacterium]